MFQKNTRLLLLTLLLCLVFSLNAIAFELSFEDAVKYMDETNIALQIAELNLQLAKLDYDRSIATNLMNESEYTRLQIEATFKRAENSYRAAKESNYLEIFRKYTEIFPAERQVFIKEAEKSIAEHNYRIVQEKIKMGDANRLDDLREQNRLEAAERGAETAKESLKESIRSLKSLLDLSEVEEFILTTEFSMPEFEYNLEECLATGLENNFDLWDRELSLKLQEMQLEKSKIEGIAPMDLKRAELNLEIARLNQIRAKEDFIERITSSYQALEQSKLRYKSVARELEIAKDSYWVSEQQKELGLITEIQLLEARLNLIKAEGSLEDTIISHILNELQFRQLLGLGVEIR